MIDKTLAHYQIVEKLGAGGMGEVYVAWDTKLRRNVALKLLPESTSADQTTLQRLEREAQAVAALSHPNIVTIYSVEDWQGTHFLTMELIDGKTLKNVIPRGGLSMDDFFQFALGVVDALNAAHEQGIVHRDLKPANIMVTRDGRAKVLDFGLAKLRHATESLAVTRSANQLITEAGTILGTIPYMSPEQLKSKPVDPRSDIFSLGTVLFEMCTGTRPFVAESSAEIMSSILRDTPTPASDLNRQCPQGLAEIIGRCLEKDPEKRYQKASELRSDLKEFCDKIRQGTVEENKTSIAVLPFTDMSSEKDNQYFCDGLAEELINALSTIEGLQVAARTSAFAVSGIGLDVRDIGKKLSVDTVLEGSVRKSGNRLRITVQLINVADGYHLWSEQYDRDMKDIFQIQDEIAHRIVQAMELAFSTDDNKVTAERGTNNVQAYDYYLRGRRFFFQHLRKGFELAQEMFTRAIEEDPTFAKAYSGIADCCCFHCLYYDGGESSLRRAEESSQRAIELGSNMAEPHASRGGVLSLLGRHAEAESEFETAIRLEPQLFDAYYLYARDCYTQGNLERAASLYGRAAEVDPDDFQSRLLLAQVCDDLGRGNQADAARRKGVEIIQRRLLAYPADVRALYLGGNGLIVLGQIDKGLEWAALALSISPNDSYVLYNVACIYSLAGKTDEALEYLKRTIKCGLTKRAWLDRDSNLDPLRGLQEFQELQNMLD